MKRTPADILREYGPFTRSTGECPETGGITRPWPVPLTEAGTERSVVDRASDLQQQVGATPRPAHLRGFVHPPIDQEIRHQANDPSGSRFWRVLDGATNT